MYAVAQNAVESAIARERALARPAWWPANAPVLAAPVHCAWV